MQVHKAVGSLMQARIEYEMEMAKRAEEEEDNQDFGEFVEDRFVELYGLKKIATENLRDMLKALKHASETHARLAIFRTISALVPNDEEAGDGVRAPREHAPRARAPPAPLRARSGAPLTPATRRRPTPRVRATPRPLQVFSDAATIFMRLVLRKLVELLNEDHLSGLKGHAFWSHYQRADVLRVPAHYLERITERIGKGIKYLKADAKGHTSERGLQPAATPGKMRTSTAIAEAAAESAVEEEMALAAVAAKEAGRPMGKSMTAKKEADTVRAVKSLEATLAQHASGELPKSAVRLPPAAGGANNAPKVNVIEVGDNQQAGKPTPKGTVGRLDIDCFLYRALEHWTRYEDMEEDMILRAYNTWDLNGDGLLQHNEFSQMIRLANPNASQRKVTRAFIAACGGAGEVVEKGRLASILLAYGFVLIEKPADYDPDAPENVASVPPVEEVFGAAAPADAEPTA